VRALVDEIFARLVVGMPDEAGARALATAVQRMLRTPGNPPLSPPGPDDGLLGRVVAAVFERRSMPVRRLLAAELRRRRDARHDGRADLLGTMVNAELDEDAALDELLALLMAGQEPPAAALTWLLDRLGRDVGLADQIVQSPTSPEGDRIRRETLRLRPAVAAVMRRLVAPAQIAGVDLPAGVVTMLPIPLLHRDARLFDDPERFRPDRFADAGPEDPPGFLPFGGGARRCLGEHLAHAEMDIVLPTALRRLRLRPLWPSPERMVVRGTVLVPHRSALMVAR
jgi:cytochrome P450